MSSGIRATTLDRSRAEVGCLKRIEYRPATITMALSSTRTVLILSMSAVFSLHSSFLEDSFYRNTP